MLQILNFKTWKIVTLVLLFSSSAKAQINHSDFTALLQKHVSQSGFVDYQSLKKEETKLDTYLDALDKNTPNSTWSRNEKMAYLINTYNACTLKLILKNYPVESIKDIGGIFGNPFKEEFIPFNGEKISLDDVEKGMLLKMKEPRVHFAINCASKSCPKLQNMAFEAETLESQLEKATREFITSSENKLTKNELYLSKIFKWYASDFETAAGSIVQFIHPYTPINLAKDASISYKDYSWELNGK